MTETTDLSARLLATENLTVVRAATKTASFDIKSRVLTLPMWQNMTPNIEDMLVAHEVGHALYTGTGYSDPIKENPNLKSFLNVLEDVRIEKLIKQKYPGLRKRMADGYNELNDRDFFGVKSTPVNQLNLIDRINMYFKAGIKCGVKFSPAEMDFVKRAEKTMTLEDVIALAQEVYEFAKNQAKENIANSIEDLLPDDIEFEETYDELDDESGEEYDIWLEDDDGNEITDSTDGDATGNGDDRDLRDSNGVSNPYEYEPETEEQRLERLAEEEIKSKTEEALAQSLEDAADQDTEYHYHSMVKERFDTTIGYKQVLEELDFDFGEDRINSYYYRTVYGIESPEDWETKQKESVKKFLAESQSAVNYLVKEFEMKKSADVYKRAQTAKVGSLDMKKIWGYKLNDDLFKRVTLIPEGKNHGMVFLLDWSGSMQNVIKDTIKQVINLSMFCRKAQIPFRVYAFTSSYKTDHDKLAAMREYDSAQYDKTKETGESYVQNGYFHFLEFFNDRMSNSEFNRMVGNLLDERVFWHNGYSLGGTPLNEALMYFYHNMGAFIKMNNIEKMNFITLTDGESQPLASTIRAWDWARDKDDYSKRIRQNHFVKCPVTQKTYKWSADGVKQSRTLFNMIKDRWDVRMVGFFLVENKKRDIDWAIRNSSESITSAWHMLSEVRQAFRQNGYYSVPGSAQDDLFLIPTNKTKIDDGELNASPDMSARKLASNLGKFVGGKKANRVLLSRFIDLVA